MTVAPALLEELLGEIGSLASAYHKPAETFIGHGRVGADSVRKEEEYVNLFLDCRILKKFKLCIFRLADDQFSAQKALQTVVAGRQAENLLQVFSFSGHRKTLMTSYIFRHRDFDDNTLMEGQPPGRRFQVRNSLMELANLGTRSILTSNS